MSFDDDRVTGAVTERGLTRYHVRLLTILFTVWLLTSMNNQLYSLVAPSILREWNLTYVHLGFISAIMPVGSILGLMTFGSLADRLGRKRLLSISTLGIGLGFLSGLAQDWIQLGVTLAVKSFAVSGIFPLVFSLAAEELPPQKRGLGISIIASAYGLGGGFLAGLTSSILTPISWRLIFFVLIVPSLATALMVEKLLQESKVWVTLKERERMVESRSFLDRIRSFGPLRMFGRGYRRSLVAALLVRALASVIWIGVAQWIVTFLATERRMSIESGATWFALFGVFGFFGNWINGSCADRFGRKATITAFFVSTGLSIIVFALLARTEIELMAMTVPIGITLLGLYPTTFTMVAELLPSEIRVGGSSLISVLLEPIVFSLPILVGVGATNFSIAMCFVAIAAFTIGTSLALHIIIPETRGRVL